MGIIRIANPQIIINNEVVSYVPNSVTLTEGFGDRMVSVQTSGNGAVETVFAQNVETAFSIFKFALNSTTDNANIARVWAANNDGNLIQVSQTDFQRSLQNAAIINNYELALSQDGTFELEFHCSAAV